MNAPAPDPRPRVQSFDPMHEVHERIGVPDPRPQWMR